MAELIERDYQRVLEIVAGNLVDTIDTRLGTADVVAEIKRRRMGVSGMSCITSCEDGPYSDKENPEWWSMHVQQDRDSFDVKIVHNRRRKHAPAIQKVLREGRVTLNQIANRATITALERRYSEQAQLVLFRW